MDHATVELDRLALGPLAGHRWKWPGGDPDRAPQPGKGRPPACRRSNHVRSGGLRRPATAEAAVRSGVVRRVARSSSPA